MHLDICVLELCLDYFLSSSEPMLVKSVVVVPVEASPSDLSLQRAIDTYVQTYRQAKAHKYAYIPMNKRTHMHRYVRTYVFDIALHYIALHYIMQYT